MMEAETEVLQPHAKERQGLTRNHQKLRRGKEGFSPVGFTGTVTQILDFQPLELEAINLCCFRLPSLWGSITEALEVE